MLSELLYADYLVLMSETMEGLINKFIKWMVAFENNGLKVNLGKTKVTVSDGITKDGLPKNKVDPCGVSRFRVKDNLIWCMQCGEWIYGRCVGVKMVNPMISRYFECRKCEILWLANA